MWCGARCLGWDYPHVGRVEGDLTEFPHPLQHQVWCPAAGQGRAGQGKARQTKVMKGRTEQRASERSILMRESEVEQNSEKEEIGINVM